MTRMTWFPWGRTETLYSIVGRAHEVSGHPDPRVTAQLAFGSPRAWSQCHFERGVECFCSYAGVDVSHAESLIARRTVTPFSHKFFDRGRSRVSGVDMRRGRNRTIKSPREHTGLFLEGTIKLLKGCPKCAAIDRESLGAPAWRVEHQLPGLAFCNVHEEPLQGAWLGPSLQWPTAASMRALRDVSYASGCLQRLGRYLNVFHQESKATRGSVQHIIEHLLRDAGILRPQRSKTDALDRWWSSAMPIELPVLFPSLDWRSASAIYRSTRPHPILLAAVLDRLTTLQPFRSLLDSQSLQRTIDGEWQSAHDSAVWELPRRVMFALEAGTHLAAVASDSGLTAEALRHWLRRNPVAKEARRAAVRACLRDGRRSMVRDGLARGLTRSDLMKTNSAQIRWLELHDWDWISQQWSGQQSESLRQRQRVLF